MDDPWRTFFDGCVTERTITVLDAIRSPWCEFNSCQSINHLRGFANYKQLTLDIFFKIDPSDWINQT